MRRSTGTAGAISTAAANAPSPVGRFAPWLVPLTADRHFDYGATRVRFTLRTPAARFAEPNLRETTERIGGDRFVVSFLSTFD